MSFPTISEYEIEIKRKGASILNLDGDYEFSVHREIPIKFYNFGSGTFATVFKIKNSKTGKFYALRCFLNNGSQRNIDRTIRIIQFLSHVHKEWTCKTEYFSSGISIKGSKFPAILMEWSTGVKINDYVTTILHNNIAITGLQQKLKELSHSLENSGLGHGDIQSGNLLVENSGSNIVFKLVDYDAFFIPEFIGQKSSEVGHSSFQHNARTKDFFDDKIDRFSIWLMLTSLEALKSDKTLWNKDLQGGFNDEDNFLFKATDISHPESSSLVKKLKNLNQPSINFYLNELFSNKMYPYREKVSLFNSQIEEKKTQKPSEPKVTPREFSNSAQSTNTNYFEISCNITSATVFLRHGLELKKLGTTPLKLDLTYSSKMLRVEANGLNKAFLLNKDERKYFINLQHSENKVIEKKYEIYGSSGGRIEITIIELEELFKSGRDLNYIFIDGRFYTIDEIPEVKNLRDKYFNVLNNKESHISYQTTAISNYKKPESVLLYIILAVLFFGGLIWFIAENSEKSYTVETANTADSAISALSDSAATVIDLTPSVAIDTLDVAVDVTNPQIPYKNQVVEDLLNSGVSNFNDNSITKPSYEGCGSYFSLSKTSNNEGSYIFTGMISSFFSNNTENFFVEMVIDGKIEYFSYYTTEKDGNSVFLRGTNMTLEITLQEIGNGEEVIMYSGEMILNKKGEIYKFPLYGISGC